MRLFRKFILFFTISGSILFLTLGLLIFSKCNDDLSESKNIKVLIILGAKVRNDGISPTLQRRLDKALPVLKKDTTIIIIVSGGKGDDEPVSEAKAMNDYLVNNGIKASRIIQEDKSFSTEENLVNCKRKLNYNERIPLPIYLSTSNYHQYRAQQLAKKVGFMPYGLSSSTPISEIPFRTFREMIAIMVFWLSI